MTHRGRSAFRRASPPAARSSAKAGVIILCALLASACTDSTTDGGGDPGPAPASISFTINGTTQVQYSGSAVWPPSGSGVIAGLDAAGTTLQIAGYTQLSAKRTGTAGPEPKFNFIYLEVRDTGGITARSYSDFDAVLGLNITLNDVDSLAYFGSAGTLTLTTVTGERVVGTFSGTLTRPVDLDVITVGGGTLSAAPGAGLFATEDSGSQGGAIAIAADTGTTPLYTWAGGPVYALTVSRVSDLNTLVWGILTAGADSIFSGVTHGTVPAGALEVGNDERVLTPGTTYRVRVNRIDGSYGYIEFTP